MSKIYYVQVGDLEDYHQKWTNKETPKSYYLDENWKEIQYDREMFVDIDKMRVYYTNTDYRLKGDKCVLVGFKQRYRTLKYDLKTKRYYFSYSPNGYESNYYFKQGVIENLLEEEVEL